MKKSISGIRGIFGEDFTIESITKFCNNFCSLINSKRCVIGQDTRPSGQEIKHTVVDTMTKNGIDVYDLGIAPTPVVFREARRYGSGIIITSSHNPIEWNGLKFIIDGRGINVKELQVVLKDQKIPKTNRGNHKNIESGYVDEAIRIIGKVQSPPKVVLDIGGGASFRVASSLLRRLGCEVEVINERLEGSSRGPDPTSDSLSELISASQNKDIGFAYDLDGDRLVLVRNGTKLSSDVTLGLGVAKALELGYKKFVLSIDTSIAVEKLITERGGSAKRSKVGEANVIDSMLKTNAQAGGEGSSAGFILPEFNYCRDGILTSGLIASMFESDSFEQTLEFMENYHQLRNMISVESNLHDKTMDLVQEKMGDKYSQVITIDGIKGIIDENSWVLVRKSNTEDIIRISSESNNYQKANEILENASMLVKNCYDEIR